MGSIREHGVAPRRVERATTRQRARTLYEAYAALHPARVIVAEDDARMRTLIATALRRDGFEVVEVASGWELLDEMGSEVLERRGHPPVDLIISDLRMPGPTGIDVLAGLRRSSWSTPFVLITAFADEETHEEAERLGASAVFDKPFDVDDLRTAVVHLVRAS